MNTQEELIREFREAAEDSIREWARRWVTDSGDSIRVRYMDDGTAEIERETSVGFDRISVNFGVSVVPAKKSNEPYGFILNRANEELANAIQDVIDYAREATKLYSEEGFFQLSQKIRALDDITNASNQPTGFTLNRAWGEVHVGWFVKTPKGAWIEVVENDEVAGGEHRKVTLLVNGNRATFTYPSHRIVPIRKGTKTKAMDDAIKLLSDTFGGASVIQDWS